MRFIDLKLQKCFDLLTRDTSISSVVAASRRAGWLYPRGTEEMFVKQSNIFQK